MRQLVKSMKFKVLLWRALNRTESTPPKEGPLKELFDEEAKWSITPKKRALKELLDQKALFDVGEGVEEEVSCNCCSFFESLCEILKGNYTPNKNIVNKYGINYNMDNRPFMKLPSTTPIILTVMFGFLALHAYVRGNGFPIFAHNQLFTVVQYLFAGSSKNVDNLVLFGGFLSDFEPSDVQQALSDPDWVRAMQEELVEFKGNMVWRLVTRPWGKSIIGLKHKLLLPCKN
ncbi:hypothetical protein OSB04_006308 [Centaurea solstitialis]|uniref:Uncharacterized protein n=1 Tax=Centaurea solstitialis TaxID=347529 RepID=A0AA38THN5_9ASTR|nr:hypothetical protein OSB04_006308 [Centaurea solstitialis]